MLNLNMVIFESISSKLYNYYSKIFHQLNMLINLSDLKQTKATKITVRPYLLLTGVTCIGLRRGIS